MNTIPIIDFQAFNTGDEASRLAIADAVHKAASEVGFMYVKNLAIDDAMIAEAFRSSADFFSLPTEQKNRCAYRPELNHGYQAIGGQRLDSGKHPDLKETMTMRNVPANSDHAELWPSAEFTRTANSMFTACLDGVNQVMEAFAIALKLPLNFFRESHLGENIALRYLHYPVITGEIGDQEMGAGAHTDFGTVTLLFQDDVGGLEVEGVDGIWQPAPYIPDTIVVNTGDLMARWTNERYRSTPHRVQPMRASKNRYSIAFFADPDSATPISVLPSCYDENGQAKFPDTTAGEHIAEKLAESHKL
ncbi:MAG: isopenicillin N synthase family dioxygenase [Thiolinea sp.]